MTTTSTERTKNPLEDFGCMVFNDRVMRARLPKDVYKKLKSTIQRGKALDPEISDIVANAMKDWAISRGVTHYTHWFQPMTGITAEKHDSFISPEKDGGIIMEFSGKELVQGEPDASSFPSGGLRATFEARGYTAWDPTSYAFIKDGVLCIPTAFCSYSGEALDKKTPLLRSMEAISNEGVRLLRAMGDEKVQSLTTTVGPEQEYFLVDKEMWKKRRDLVFCGRTLFGALPPKGQEMEDHYFGTIKTRVQAYMNELNQELWKLGILAKTEHNEVAPAQHELAPIFATTNIATDHNQLTMELMKRIADKHGLVCLLHEKPFAGVNGSGKHNNWSISTDKGENLLNPTAKPEENLRFLMTLAAVMKAVDDYQDLLRCSVTSAGNDHRLGANEAPPAIISMFLGTELEAVIESVISGTPVNRGAGTMSSGVKILPDFKKDNTDRNRTSPFAFTGNKFEFRMLGSSISISGPNFVLNTIVAESFAQFADELEQASDKQAASWALVKKTFEQHQRIVFNGNNYSDEWVAEAERRGLLNLKSTAEALPVFINDKNIALFVKHNILTEKEVRSRYDILIENYCKTLHIEALTMLEMVRRELAPSISAYIGELAEAAEKKRSVSKSASVYTEVTLIDTLSEKSEKMMKAADALQKNIKAMEKDESDCKGKNFHDKLIPAMEKLRGIVDGIEPLMSAKHWEMPTYGELLFGV